MPPTARITSSTAENRSASSSDTATLSGLSPRSCAIATLGPLSSLAYAASAGGGISPLLLVPLGPFIPQRTDIRPLVPSMTLRKRRV